MKNMAWRQSVIELIQNRLDAFRTDVCPACAAGETTFCEVVDDVSFHPLSGECLASPIRMLMMHVDDIRDQYANPFNEKERPRASWRPHHIVEFHDQPLLVADHIDSAGDLIPLEVLEKAVAEAGELPILEKFRADRIQGKVTLVKMKGNEAVIDGFIMSSEAGSEVLDFLKAKGVEYAACASGTPQVGEDGVRVYKDLKLISVSAVAKGTKIR